MPRFQIQSISQDKFLRVTVNLLHKAFVEATRTEAKAVYKRIAAGEAVHLTTVRIDHQSTAAFYLSLAHSEFRGQLNYGAFRASVTALIANLSRALREKRELKVFSALNGGNAVIFGITAVTREDGEPNVMVLAADSPPERDATVLQLMYLDPAQFPTGTAPAKADGTR